MTNTSYQITPFVLQYLPLLAVGDQQALMDLFDGEPLVDDPVRGRVSGPAAFEQYVMEMHTWLSERQVRVEPLATTQAGHRGVSEAVAHLVQDDQPLPFPMAIAADLVEPGGKLHLARTYYSTQPMLGYHLTQAPLLPVGDDTLTLYDVVRRYHDALSQGDVESLVHLFQPDGVLREASSAERFYRGRPRLRAFFSELLAKGGITLEPCCVADDGVRCAVEYNMLSYGGQPLEPQAGLAVYERGPTGLLAAARLYHELAEEA